MTAPLDLDALEAAKNYGGWDLEVVIDCLIERLRLAEAVCAEVGDFDLDCQCSCPVPEHDDNRCGRCLGCTLFAALAAWRSARGGDGG